MVCQTCRTMGRLGGLLLIALAAMACLDAPASARITASDAAATRAYLEARIALQRTAMSDEPSELKAIAALEAQVKAECPDVLTGAPPRVKGEKTNQSEYEISDELLIAGFGAGGHVEHPADVRFARTVRRLRWSNSKLTRLLRSLAIEQAEQSAISLPNLSSDMKFWVASGYTTVSPGTKAFLHRFAVVSSMTVIESEPHEPVSDFLHPNALVAHRLKPYENHADRLLAVKALPPEPKLTELSYPGLKPLVEAVGKVFVALGRSPTPAP